VRIRCRLILAAVETIEEATMPVTREQLPKPLQEIMEDFPETGRQGSPAWNIAAQATRLAHMRGLDPASDEFADVIRQQLDELPTKAGGGGVKSAEKTIRARPVKLTDAEKEVAAFSNLTPEQYAENKKACQREGLLGRHASGV
jgi:hypothetical protein